MTLACLVVGLLAATQGRPVFPSSVELVTVVVSVTDKKGEPVRDLDLKDFVLSEEGKKRPIETFLRTSDSGDSEAAPVDLVLLLDTSTSMNEDLVRARDVMVDFVKALPSVRGRGIVAFDNDVRPWHFEADNIGPILDDILLVRTGLGTRFFDGIIEGLKRVSKGPGRKAMVAFTDGEDYGSRKSMSDALGALREAEVTFYAVSFAAHLHSMPAGAGHSGPPFRPVGAPLDLTVQGPEQARRSFSEAASLESRSNRAAGGLRSFASATGGMVVDMSAGDLATRFARIRSDIAAQYVLGFAPAPSSASVHRRLKVEVRRKDVKVRHREGYQTRPPS